MLAKQINECESTTKHHKNNTNWQASPISFLTLLHYQQLHNYTTSTLLIGYEAHLKKSSVIELSPFNKNESYAEIKHSSVEPICKKNAASEENSGKLDDMSFKDSSFAKPHFQTLVVVWFSSELTSDDYFYEKQSLLKQEHIKKESEEIPQTFNGSVPVTEKSFDKYDLSCRSTEASELRNPTKYSPSSQQPFIKVERNCQDEENYERANFHGGLNQQLIKVETNYQNEKKQEITNFRSVDKKPSSINVNKNDTMNCTDGSSLMKESFIKIEINDINKGNQPKAATFHEALPSNKVEANCRNDEGTSGLLQTTSLSIDSLKGDKKLFESKQVVRPQLIGVRRSKRILNYAASAVVVNDVNHLPEGFPNELIQDVNLPLPIMRKRIQRLPIPGLVKNKD